MIHTSRIPVHGQQARVHSRAPLVGLLSLLLVLAGTLAGAGAGAASTALAAGPVNGYVATWTQLSPGTHPSSRSLPSMAFDQRTGQLILFGGADSNKNPLGDTWGWNGSTWTRLSTSGPSPRFGASMAYDPAIGDIVLFGGFDGNEVGSSGSPLSDTWAWVNGEWIELFPSAGPPARLVASMAFDPGTGRLILYGGESNQGIYFASGNQTIFGDTWSFDGSTWTEVSSTGPPARYMASMAFGPGTGQLVLFGGNPGGGASGNAGSQDVWNWDGHTWHQLSPVQDASQRFAASLDYDPATGQLVLFGGFNSTDNTDRGELGDTWTWNGSTWTQLGPITSPSARDSMGTAFDPATGQFVLFGGEESSTLGDTWVYAMPAAGQAWAQASTSGPSARYHTSMAFDPATGQFLLFGGANLSGALADTWSWNGTSWSALGPSHSPSLRYEASMAYDQATGQLILFGGRAPDGSALGDTWSWDGSDWNQLTPTASPPARYDASMAFSAVTGELILLGGKAGDGSTLGDTWAWDGTGWKTALNRNGVSPPARSGAAMSFDPATGQLVLFGGQAGDGSSLADTWNYGFFGWIQATPTTSPAGTASDPNTDFDPATGQMVLTSTFEGVGPYGRSTDTWNWDGKTWSQLSPSITYSDSRTRWYNSLAFDPATGQLVQFGGLGGDGAYKGDTWIYVPVPKLALTVAAAGGVYSGTTTLEAIMTYGGSSVPGEIVSFSLNGTAVCDGSTGVTCPTTDSNGVAKLSNVSLSGLNAGTYPNGGSCGASAGVSASFAGDTSNSYPAASACNSLQVNKEATYIGVSAGPSNPRYGQAVAFTIQVHGDAAVPTGSVTFSEWASSKNGTVPLDSSGDKTVTLLLDSSGKAAFTTTTPLPGDAILYPQVTYTSDNPNISGSYVDRYNRLFAQSTYINPDDTTTAVSTDQTSPTVGQKVTITAAIAPNYGFTPVAGTAPPTGPVTFYDGSIDSAHQIGTGSLSTDATTGKTTAAFSTSSLSAGSHTIIAVYGDSQYGVDGAGIPVYGDANYGGSSGSLAATVRSLSTTTLTSSLTPSILGQSVTFTAAVSVTSPGAGSINGTVTFKDGTTTLGTGTVSTTNGVSTATLTTSSLPVGAHTITAVYGGSSTLVSSTSPGLTQYVDTNLSSFPKLSNGAYNLSNANLSGAYLVQANLAGAKINSANLSGANLSGATLSGANLTSANFSNTNLTGANLTGANLTSANFTGANLTSANLTNANLTQTNLKGAQGMSTASLTGVIWSKTTCPDNTTSNQDGGTCLGHL